MHGYRNIGFPTPTDHRIYNLPKAMEAPRASGARADPEAERRRRACGASSGIEGAAMVGFRDVERASDVPLAAGAGLRRTA